MGLAGIQFETPRYKTAATTITSASEGTVIDWLPLCEVDCTFRAEPVCATAAPAEGEIDGDTLGLTDGLTEADTDSETLGDTEAEILSETLADGLIDRLTDGLTDELADSD